MRSGGHSARVAHTRCRCQLRACVVFVHLQVCEGWHAWVLPKPMPIMPIMPIRSSLTPLNALTSYRQDHAAPLSLPSLSRGSPKRRENSGYARSRARQASLMLRAALAEGVAWTALESWARQSGLSYSGWKVGEINGIRGAVATKSLKAGDILVTAPKRSVLMVRAGDQCPLPPDFIDAQYWDEVADYWNIRMALRLLYEKSLGENSSWKAYLDVMPRSFSTPLNWADKELEELQFAPLIQELSSESAYFKSQAQRMQRFLAQPIAQEEVFWALSCAGSRTFTADFDDGGPTAEAMCPIADMVNHNEASAPAFRWNEEEQVFELFSPVSVPRGGEVSISYGEVNNAHLLHYYGFIPGSNVFNSVPITEHEIQAAARELDRQQVRSFFITSQTTRTLLLHKH